MLASTQTGYEVGCLAIRIYCNRVCDSFLKPLVETVKEPIVWAPVLAFVIVLSGFRIPQLLVHSLFLLGHASGGVAMFACGIVLASGKIRVNWYVCRDGSPRHLYQ
jgi:predicted permease